MTYSRLQRDISLVADPRRLFVEALATALEADDIAVIPDQLLPKW